DAIVAVIQHRACASVGTPLFPALCSPKPGDPGTPVDDRSIAAKAAELVGLAPDVMVTSVSTTRAVQEPTQTIPIVIATGGDPVANDLIQNIARPEGNITGFISNEPSMAGKCLESAAKDQPTYQ